MRFCSFLVLTLLLSGPELAQPFSQSMAQCAGLYDAVGGFLSRPDRKAKLAVAAAAFGAAAVAEARTEGQDDPEGWVQGHRDAMRADWETRGKWSAFSAEYRDWTAYCAKFAKDRGIDLDLDLD